jgi:hypothetical protein
MCINNGGLGLFEPNLGKPFCNGVLTSSGYHYDLSADLFEGTKVAQVALPRPHAEDFPTVSSQETHYIRRVDKFHIGQTSDPTANGPVEQIAGERKPFEPGTELHSPPLWCQPGYVVSHIERDGSIGLKLFADPREKSLKDL